MLITQSPQFTLGDSVLLLLPVRCLVLCSAASSQKPGLSDFSLEELIFSQNRKFRDGPLCVQIEQLHPITAGSICLPFTWPLPHVPGSKPHFCIQGRRKMGSEEAKVTPASSISFCHGNKSCPEFAPVLRLLLKAPCPESGHMGTPSYQRVCGTELGMLRPQTKLRLH